jgi:hypothetical protein
MAGIDMLDIMDRMIRPKEWYEFSELTIQGFQLIATKDDQKYAGQMEKPPQLDKKRLGPNPIKLYRDYYGVFNLKTKLIADELRVKFAIGYTMHSKVVTIDDYSNFGWLRLATGIEDFIYPNLCHQKQLLDYLLAHSKQPKFIITRVYDYLQTDLHQCLTQEILKRESAG